METNNLKEFEYFILKQSIFFARGLNMTSIKLLSGSGSKELRLPMKILNSFFLKVSQPSLKYSFASLKPIVFFNRLKLDVIIEFFHDYIPMKMEGLSVFLIKRNESF